MLCCVPIESDPLGYFLGEGMDDFVRCLKFQGSLTIISLLFIDLESGDFFQAHFMLPQIAAPVLLLSFLGFKVGFDCPTHLAQVVIIVAHLNRCPVFQDTRLDIFRFN